jgi:magnesium transporter
MTANGTKYNELRQLVRSQLELLLESGNLQGAKSLLIPVQPVDIAEAIEGYSANCLSVAFQRRSDRGV